MKLQTRIFSIVMAMSFLMATTGFSVYKHYCGGNLVNTSIYNSDSNCSEDNCESFTYMDCCKEQVQFLKLDIDLKNSEIQKSNFPQFALVLLSFTSYVDAEPNSQRAERIFTPPLISDQPFYILHQQLTLYS